MVIGFSQIENNNPWRIALTNSMRDEAEKYADKLTLVTTDAQGQTSKQVSDVEDLIAQQVDVIFLTPRDFYGLEPVLQKSKEVGIPVFLLDRAAQGVAGVDYVTLIGSDFVAQGRRVAEWLIKETNGKAKIVELTGTSGSSAARDRSQGFNEAIKSYPDMKIIASQTGDFSRATAIKVVENLIQSKGREIDVIYAHNDEMALGAIQALKTAEMKPGKDVLVVSIDGEKEALEAILRGELNITIETNPRMGPLAFDMLEKFLRREEVSPRVIVTDRLYDVGNAKQFLNDAY